MPKFATFPVLVCLIAALLYAAFICLALTAIYEVLNYLNWLPPELDFD